MKKRLKKYGYVVFLALALLAGAVNIRVTEPENPLLLEAEASEMQPQETDMESRDNLSPMNLLYHSTGVELALSGPTAEPETEEESDREQQTDSRKDTEQKQEAGLTSAVQERLDEIDANNGMEDSEIQEDGTEQGTGGDDTGETGSGNGSGTGEGDSRQEDGDGGPYFRTSIVNGDLVDEEAYSFTLTHLRGNEVSPRGVTVTCNGEAVGYAAGQLLFGVKLQEGENSVTVRVLYHGAEGDFYVSQTYVLYYKLTGELELYVSPEPPARVSEESVVFTAYGMKGDRKVVASVTVNGKGVHGDGDAFTVPLASGSNTIVVSAGGITEQKSVTYTVVREDTEFYVWTTISDRRIYGLQEEEVETVSVTGPEPELVFEAGITHVTGQEQIEKIRANDQVISMGEDGKYHAPLLERKVTPIRLVYRDSEGKQHGYTYQVTWTRDGDSTDEAHEAAFQAQVEVQGIRQNLVNGMEFSTPELMVIVRATSYAGEVLYGNHISYTYNGLTKTGSDSMDISGEWLGFRTYLDEGANTITIRVTDNDGYYTERTYTVYYQEQQITVTLSVDAKTVGLGYLIEPTDMQFESGTSLAQMVTELLEKNGYSWGYTGSVDSGFYLASIQRTGITAGYHVDSDLEAALTEDLAGEGYTGTPFSEDSLGEQDFAMYSGWMYEYNGSYASYGMSSCIPGDASVVRIRFTLAQGRDFDGTYGQEW